MWLFATPLNAFDVIGECAVTDTLTSLEQME